MKSPKTRELRSSEKEWPIPADDESDESRQEQLALEWVLGRERFSVKRSCGTRAFAICCALVGSWDLMLYERIL